MSKTDGSDTEIWTDETYAAHCAAISSVHSLFTGYSHISVCGGFPPSAYDVMCPAGEQERVKPLKTALEETRAILENTAAAPSPEEEALQQRIAEIEKEIDSPFVALAVALNQRYPEAMANNNNDYQGAFTGASNQEPTQVAELNLNDEPKFS